jgi:putative Holliday junction resolvase
MIGPVLGVDPGSRRIGLAVSDALGISARPLAVVDAGGDAATVIGTHAEELGVKAIVVGLAVGLSGSEGDSAKRARDLADQLAAVTGLPIEFADERFSTARAEELLRDRVRDRRERRKLVDAAAAAVILQGWLDAKAAQERGNPRYR